MTDGNKAILFHATSWAESHPRGGVRSHITGPSITFLGAKECWRAPGSPKVSQGDMIETQYEAALKQWSLKSFYTRHPRNAKKYTKAHSRTAQQCTSSLKSQMFHDISCISSTADDKAFQSSHLKCTRTQGWPVQTWAEARQSWQTQAAAWRWVEASDAVVLEIKSLGLCSLFCSLIWWHLGTWLVTFEKNTPEISWDSWFLFAKSSSRFGTWQWANKTSGNYSHHHHPSPFHSNLGMVQNFTRGWPTAHLKLSLFILFGTSEGLTSWRAGEQPEAWDFNIERHWKVLVQLSVREFTAIGMCKQDSPNLSSASDFEARTCWDQVVRMHHKFICQPLDL